jgi:hypothetical protein
LKLGGVLDADAAGAAARAAKAVGGRGMGRPHAGARTQAEVGYCPDLNRRAPPAFEATIEGADLRNFQPQIQQHGTAHERDAAQLATGGAAAGAGSAFWCGGGRKDARDAGFSAQEDAGGASGLEKMGGSGHLPGEWSDKGHPKDSRVTQERLWKTISRRSAENARGTVTAFVKPYVHRNNVFASVELPTLLHNPNVQQIKFQAPEQLWHRNPPDEHCRAGRWNGPRIAGLPHDPADPNRQGGEFDLHPAEGIAWIP